MLPFTSTKKLDYCQLHQGSLTSVVRLHDTPSVCSFQIARQAPPGGNGPIPQGMAGGMGPGNLGMQGLGNIPDPTVWIAKGQEIASQFAKGRRRRQIPQPKIPDVSQYYIF